MNQVHPCKDDTELIPLYPSRGLFLKPIARINISVHYPELKQSLSSGGKSVSSWDIMERIKALVAPEIFISLRVVKNTLEFIRFEGDLENRTVLKNIISRLDGKTMKVTGFKDLLKIRTGESKLPFPSKYDWDSFFRDAKNMNEMKAGERPDTVHLQNLPCKWFSDTPTVDKPLPSERVFRRVWDVFGGVRCVDIPICDPYRSQMTSSIGGIKTFTFSNDNVFEAYVQYKDYISFVKAMDALRGCFLFFQESGKFSVANMKVDFDKSKHLSDESIRKRKAERDRLSDKDKQKKTADKLTRMELQNEETRKHEKEKKDTDKTMAKIEYKIAMEERKYLIARRKLEAIRLIDYLFETVKRQLQKKADKQKLQEKMQHKAEKESKKFEKAMEKYQHKNDTEDEEEDERPRKKKHRHSLDDGSESDSKSPDDEDLHRNKRRHPSVEEKKPRHPEITFSDKDDDKAHHSDEKERRHAGPSRYLGDWEVKAKSTLGSQVQVSSNYVPVGHGNPRGDYYGHPRGDYHGHPRGDYHGHPRGDYHGNSRGDYHGHPRGDYHGHPRGNYPYPYRGRGRGDGFYRGRGRGGPYNSHQDHFSSHPEPSRYPRDNPEEDQQHHQGYHHHHRGGGTRRPSNSNYFHNRASRGGYGRGFNHSEPPPNEERDREHKHDKDFQDNRDRERSQSRDRESPQNSREPIVHHDFSYLDDLDKAYEKYFMSITKRHDHET